MDEIRRSREQLQRMKELEEENEKVIEENNLLQDKLDELLTSIDAAYDRIEELSKIVNEKDDELAKLYKLLPNIEELEKCKKRIAELEKECDSLKAEIIRNKQQAGKMYQELLERLKSEQDKNAKFNPNYFSIGRFIRILEKRNFVTL